jgi:hypothetical protein
MFSVAVTSLSSSREAGDRTSPAESGFVRPAE